LEHSTNIPAGLVIKAGKGDRNAQARLYQLYSRAMFNKCLRMAGNKTDAEDILQDAFIYAFEHINELREPAAFVGWLQKIVIGKCIKAGKTSLKWDDIDESYMGTPADEDFDWWTDIQMEQVHEEIKNLPDGCRQVFVLFVFENYGHKQVGESLGISESTSKSQYQRARKLLQERLTKRISING
jgi:RNA polymerase sigma factor (sigma-70 family)